LGQALRTAAHSSLVGLLVGVPLLGDRLPEPWDMFVPFAFALAVGSQAGTAAAYLRRRADAAWPAGL
jgi:ABC-type Mn2+/Zn2+ transport system permease subunit